MSDPIKKTVTVPLTPDQAFDLFTAGIDRWWPKESHSLAAAQGEGEKSSVRVEPETGGRILETLPDGSVAPWGTVTVWDPGRRLAIDWYVGRSPDEATRIDLRFSPSDIGTRVDLTHSNFKALGDRAAEVSASYDSGWDHVLGHCYAGACQRRAA